MKVLTYVFLPTK